MQGFFRNIGAQIESHKETCEEVLKAQGHAEHLNRTLKGFRFFGKEETHAKTNFQLLLEDIVEFLENSLAMLEQQLKNNANLGAILSIFQHYGLHKTASFRFSEKSKHTGIKLSADGLTATQDNNYTNNIAIIEPAIEGKRRLTGKRSIRLRVSRPSSWLSLGAAYIDPLRKANFELNTSNTGHGAYMLSFNGYSFHNDDPAFNSYYHPFSFADGDVLTVTVFASEQRILFEKESG